MGKIRIALDLDGVIIGKPPFIPKSFLEWLFRGSHQDGLFYRFPTLEFEKRIRKISHFYLFRPPVKKNTEFVKKIAKNKKYEIFIISGRYSFLRKETETWLSKNKLEKLFKKVFLNLGDEQPHLFKEKILKKTQPELFLDDDNLLADYLVDKIPGTKIYCLVSGDEHCLKAKEVTSLEQILR